jgi:Uma2 family endonuclease
MAIANPSMTLEAFLALPEEKPALEFEDGEVVQKVSPQGKHSLLQATTVSLINATAMPRKIAVALTELRSTYARASRVPDISVYTWDRVPRDANGDIANVFTTPPDIAIEILSPGQSVPRLIQRCLRLLRDGSRIVLLLDPEDLAVMDFRDGAMQNVLRGSDVVDLEPVIPGLKLTVDEIFAPLRLD